MSTTFIWAAAFKCVRWCNTYELATIHIAYKRRAHTQKMVPFERVNIVIFLQDSRSL